MRLLDSNSMTPVAPHPDVQAAVASLSSARLREWVSKISKPRHFEAQREQNRATANWLAAQFEEWGYEVLRQGECDNVVALPPQRGREMLLAGAHYDSQPGTPGADDNGSAVAAMLECARLLAESGPRPEVCFVGFNREEDGMIGSAEFVESYLPHAGFTVREAHILEMVGFASREPGSQRVPPGLPITLPDRGDFLGILANQNSSGMMEAILKGARTYVPGLKVMALEVVPGAERVFPVLARSDHVPFWRRNISSVMWTDTSEFRNPHYHQPTDTPDTLDYDFLLRVTQVLAACLAAR